jgi:hypothetical protein
MKLLLATEECVTSCSKQERRETAWFRAGIWKLRGTRKGLENGRCPLCNGKEDVAHILLKCPKTRETIPEQEMADN